VITTVIGIFSQKACIFGMNPTIYHSGMKLKQTKSGLVLFGGWLMILLSAAIILPRDVSNAVAYPIIFVDGHLVSAIGCCAISLFL